MSKKKFELNQSVNTGLSKIVKLSESYHMMYNTQIIAVESVKTDLTNPRKISIKGSNIESIRSKLDLDIREDSFFKIMKEALDQLIDQESVNREQKLVDNQKLIELAFSVRKNGLLHPILVYKDLDCYFIVAGERRLLAHIILGESYIEAKIFKKKPSGLSRKMTQWVENIQRDDLNLNSKLLNIKDIYDEYNKEIGKKLTPSSLMKISGMTKAPASKYLSLLNAPEDVLGAVRAQDINDLESAVMIARISDEERRRNLVEYVKQGANRRKVHEEISKHKTVRKIKSKLGRPTKKVNFGYTTSTDTARKIIEAVLKQYSFKNLEEATLKLNWDNYTEVSEFFRMLLNILEESVQHE